MELKQFLKIYMGQKNFLLMVVTLGIVVAVIVTFRLPSGYSQSRLFYLESPKISSPVDYDYQGYYAQAKARDFTDTAVAILESTDFNSEVGLSEVNLSVRKIAPQILRLTVVAKHPQDAENAILQISQGFNQKMSDLTGNDQELKIKPVGQARPAHFSSPNKIILGIFGGMLGFIFGILVVGLKVYFKV